MNVVFHPEFPRDQRKFEADYYVAAYLRSRFGQMLIERYITGATGQLHLYAKDVAKISVPVVPPVQQFVFEQHAKDALAAKLEAESLLACAQRAVEVAIEQGEAAAMKLLEWLAGVRRGVAQHLGP